MQGYHTRMEYADDLKMLKKFRMEKSIVMPDVALDNTLLWENKVIVITDCNLRIIHATQNIFDMSGYKPQEVIGKKPDIFQGEKTTSEERNVIRIAVDAQKPFDTIITNYKKDGTMYKCHIEAYPVFNRRGECVNFIAVENAA